MQQLGNKKYILIVYACLNLNLPLKKSWCCIIWISCRPKGPCTSNYHHKQCEQYENHYEQDKQQEEHCKQDEQDKQQEEHCKQDEQQEYHHK